MMGYARSSHLTANLADAFTGFMKPVKRVTLIIVELIILRCIQPANVAELVAQGAEVVVLSNGRY